MQTIRVLSILLASSLVVSGLERFDQLYGSNTEGLGFPDVDVFLEKSTTSGLQGDVEENGGTYTTSLVLVSPASSSEEISWEADIYDNDEAAYEDDVKDSENPTVAYLNLIQSVDNSLIQTIDNSLDRDEGELPSSIDDKGDDAADGKFLWMLLSNFTDGQNGTGSIISFPKDPFLPPYFLISGLDKPVGICFDINHDFLYVVDPTNGNTGYIYQFEIDYDSDDRFVLSSADYVIIYEGANPYSCFVDEYGNLYFSDATEEKINFVDYLDLWSGYTNYYKTLYSSSDTSDVNVPVGVNVYESEDLYFVNNEVSDDNGILYKAEVNKGSNGGELELQMSGSEGAWGVTVSDDYVYYTTKDGSLWALDRDHIKDGAVTKASKYFVQVRGVCYGDDNVYVADYGRGILYVFNDNDDEEVPDLFALVPNVYAVYAVNSAATLVITLALLASI